MMSLFKRAVNVGIEIWTNIEPYCHKIASRLGIPQITKKFLFIYINSKPISELNGVKEAVFVQISISQYCAQVVLKTLLFMFGVFLFSSEILRTETRLVSNVLHSAGPLVPNVCKEGTL